MLLATRTWGDPGGPVVVLVHGVAASTATWWRVGPALAERGYHVLAVDLPGHGASPRMDRPFTLADLADDLWRTVDAAEVVPARADLAAFLDAERRANPRWGAGDVAGRADTARCQAEEVAAALEAGIIPDLVGALRGLRVPALVVLGAAERGSMVTGAERAAVLDAAPAALELDAGHAVHRDAPDRYLAVTTGWLEDGRTGA